MLNQNSTEKRYYRFPRSSSVVDYGYDYTDYYPDTDSNGDDNETNRNYYDESYKMKGDEL